MIRIKFDNRNCLNIAIKIIKSGGIISFRTDTVYALACNASNNKSIEKIFNIKSRDKNNPISIFIEEKTIGDKFYLNNIEKMIIESFIPGPITIILKKKQSFKLSKYLVSHDSSSDYVGIRIPDDEFIKSLLKLFKGSIAATSVNISGLNPINNPDIIEKTFGDDIDLLIDRRKKNNYYNISSTIIQIIDNKINILREGKISKSEIEAVIAQW